MRIVKFNDLTALHLPQKSEFERTISEILLDSDFILGKSVEHFEEDFSKFVGSSFAISVANGSDALRIALITAGVTSGDRVGLAVNTYFAAAAAIAHLGAIPVFVDVDINTRFPSHKSFDAVNKIGLRFFIQSHLFGFADQIVIDDFLDKPKIIHDCSQAHGTEIDGKHVGLNQLSTFSFYPGKNLGAFGDSGAITTSNIDEYVKVRMLRNQGVSNLRYLHEEIGFNSRLDTIQAKILSIKLKLLKSNNIRRAQIASIYDENLKNLSERLILFEKPKNYSPTYHLYQIRLKGSNIGDLENFMRAKGIEVGRHYPIPLHLQPAFNYLGYKKNDFPNAEILADETLSLPMHPNLNMLDQEYVIESIKEYLKLRK